MVGARCAVASCNNSYVLAKKRGHVLSLHCFPKDRNLKERWVQACLRADKWNPDTSFICSDHFALEDFISDQRLQLWTGVKWRPQLKHGAIPTKNLSETKRSKYRMGQRHSPEPHRRFSMFQVLSIELENRQGKTHQEICRSGEPNVRNADCPSDLQNGCCHEVSSTANSTHDRTMSNPPSSPILLRESDDKRTPDRSSSHVSYCGSTGSDTDNYEGLFTESPAQPTSKSLSTTKLHTRTQSAITSRIFDTTNCPNLSTNRKDLDFGGKKSRLSPVNSSIIYSCPAFELFVDDGEIKS